MGRIKNSGTSNGTAGSPQISLEQEQLANDMAQTEQQLVQETEEMLFAQLDETNIKYTRENILFIARDGTGQIVFLEIGNKNAGLTHIIERHAKNFKEAFNVDVEQIPMYLKNVVQYGEVVSNEIVIRNGKKGFERKYDYNGKYHVITGIGLNGFIVSAYPREILR